jgi:PAS domain S-box-containing protein
MLPTPAESLDVRASTARSQRLQWAWLAALLLVLGLSLVWTRHAARSELLAQQRIQLDAQSRAIGENLSRQLQGAWLALLGVREDFTHHWPAAEVAERGASRLKALADAMPGVRTLSIVDAQGRVLASNRPGLVGMDVSGRDYFRTARARNDPAVALLSPPFRTALDVYAMNLSAVLTAHDGGFGGVVTATLDPEYFTVVLNSALYAPDMWSAIAHDDGTVALYVPPRPELLGTGLDRPGSMFRRHREAGNDSTVFEGRVLSTADERMIAQRTLRPPGVPLDHPLVTAVSRGVDAMLAPWRAQTRDYVLLYALLVAGSCAGMLLLQRRQRAADGAQLAHRERERRDAERLAVALQGAELGLWDLDLRTGVSTVNARWCEMLGIAPFAHDEAGACWRALLHPDDRDRVVAAQDAHVRGETAAFEQVYRMRHADGRWLWILDRGRVIERDAQGRALRIAGTHMDMTERTEALQALERNEESLAITLHSIGDAVIATDAQGLVTRTNAAAQRLIGWPGDEAIGRPLGEVFRIFNSRTREPAVDPVRQVLADGKVVGLANDTLLVARDGAEYQIADSAAPIRDRAGVIVGVVMVFSDVTERYRVESRLRDRERQLSAITDALPGPVSRADREGRYLFANAAYQSWFGLPPEAVVGRTQREVLGRYHEAVEPYVRRALEGETVTYEAPVRQADGALLHALVTLVPDRGDDGAVQGHFTVVTDITARKRAEEAVRQGELRLRALLDILPAGVVVHAADTRIVDANPAACRMLGLSLEQMLGKAAVDPYWTLLDESRVPLEIEAFPVSRVLASGDAQRGMTVGIRRPELPHPVWATCSAWPLRDAKGRIEQIVVAFADITALQETTEHLRLLEAAVARLNDVVLITAIDESATAPPRIVFVNDAFERVTGYSRDEALGRNPRFLQGPQTDRAEAARIGAAVRRREPVHTTLLNYARDGRAYWTEIDIVPLADRRGRIAHMVAVQRDVTERRRDEQRLHAALDQLEATLGAIPDPLFEIDADGVVHHVHSPHAELLVATREAQVGRRVEELLPPEAAAVMHAALRQAGEAGTSSGHQYRLEVAAGPRWFELSVARKAQSGPPARFVVLARDVTERRQAEAERQQLEQQLRESQKMESIGTLAGGIAHDFNNILAAILGNVALARQDAAPVPAVLASLEQIQRAGLRARHLVQQILAFSRREAQGQIVQPLAPVVDETVALLRATLPAGVRLQALLPAAPVWASVDATQVQQVLMNLCTNAWHALPMEGGRIEIGLDGVPAGPAPCAHLWVRDNGHGMDAATRARIFDPFFTTKPVGQGTGLGLSVVHGIVRAHGGTIEVETAPGQGSTFHVRLPAVAAGTPAVPEPAQPEAAGVVGGGRHVLYVDDDEVMRLTVERLLARAGFRVTTAGDVETAVARVQQAHDPIDAVISDYNMPVSSGLDAARRLALLRPGLPVVISTGYVSDELQAQAAAAGVRALLRKENTFEELPALLDRLLAGA